MSRWQPIDTAPRDGTVVLLWADSHYPVVGWFCKAADQVEGLAEKEMWFDVWQHDWSSPNQPTHWQPLPEPPQ